MQFSLKNRMSASASGPPDPTRAETRRQRSGVLSGVRGAALPVVAAGWASPASCCWRRGGVARSGALLAAGGCGGGVGTGLPRWNWSGASGSGAGVVSAGGGAGGRATGTGDGAD